jgi:GTP cyclohydrolase II
MTNEELNQALYNRLSDEQMEWKKWLLSQSPEEVLQHAYEYTSREDIILALEYTDLSDEQCLALLKSPCPLADIFKEFERMESEHMEEIRQSIESRADYVIRQEKDKEER